MNPLTDPPRQPEEGPMVARSARWRIQHRWTGVNPMTGVEDVLWRVSWVGDDHNPDLEGVGDYHATLAHQAYDRGYGGHGTALRGRPSAR